MKWSASLLLGKRHGMLFFFKEVFLNDCHCTPMTGTEIRQPVARQCSWCQDVPDFPRADQTRAELDPNEKKRLVLSSFPSLCIISGVGVGVM